MLSFGLTLIVTICLSVLCVYVSNSKPLIHHRGKKTVIYNAEDHKDLSKNTGIGKVYQNPRIKSNARPMKADTWTVGIAGHA